MKAEPMVAHRQIMINERKVFLPRTMDELWKILADHPGAQVFGGGTDLMVWGSIGPTVVRLPDVEKSLMGRFLNRETLESVLPLIRQRLTPIDDVRASAAYRRQVAANLLLRVDRPGRRTVQAL